MQPPLQLPLQVCPLDFGLEEPPATVWAHADMRRVILRLLHLGQAILSACADERTSLSKDTPQLLQSYSKIGISHSPTRPDMTAVNA